MNPRGHGSTQSSRGAVGGQPGHHGPTVGGGEGGSGSPHNRSLWRAQDRDSEVTTGQQHRTMPGELGRTQSTKAFNNVLGSQDPPSAHRTPLPVTHSWGHKIKVTRVEWTHQQNPSNNSSPFKMCLAGSRGRPSAAHHCLACEHGFLKDHPAPLDTATSLAQLSFKCHHLDYKLLLGGPFHRGLALCVQMLAQKALAAGETSGM